MKEDEELLEEKKKRPSVLSRRSTGGSMSLIPPGSSFSLTECLKSAGQTTPRLLPINTSLPLSSEVKSELKSAREMVSPKLSPLNNSHDGFKMNFPKLGPLNIDKSRERAAFKESLSKMEAMIDADNQSLEPLCISPKNNMEGNNLNHQVGSKSGDSLVDSLTVSRRRMRRGTFSMEPEPAQLEPLAVQTPSPLPLPDKSENSPLPNGLSKPPRNPRGRRDSVAGFPVGNGKLAENNRRHSTSDIPALLEKGNADQETPRTPYLGWEIITGIKRHRNWSCQDRLIMLSPFKGGCLDRAIFGVCDGHGPEGHKAAEFCALNVYSFLKKASLKHSSTTESISRALHNLHRSLVSTKNDFRYSGCTLCCGFFNLVTKTLRIINIGDSRCCLIQNNYMPNDPNTLNIVQLSVDHKPSVPGERCRIESSGGIIDKCAEKDKERLTNNRNISFNDLPHRVWRPFQNLPGIAMSRSVGDTEAKKLGVSCEPEIHEHKIQEQDQYLVVASDGIWDIYSNQQVLNFLLPYIRNRANPSKMAQLLCKSAQRKWLESKSTTDDISCVIVYIPDLLACASTRTDSTA